MESLFGELWNSIDLLYVFMCNIVTYLIISCIPTKVDLATGWKRLISAVVAVLLGIACVRFLGHEHEKVFYGFFLQFLMYDYVLKWLLKKFDMPEHPKPEPPQDDMKVPDEE